MRFPIDTSRLKFLVVAPAEELRQFEEGKPRESWAARKDANGEVLWRVQVVALGDGDAEIIRVTVAGDPKVGQGEMVRVTGMYFGFPRRSVPVFFCPIGSHAKAMTSQRVTALNVGAWPRRGRSPRPLRRVRRNRPRQRSTRAKHDKKS